SMLMRTEIPLIPRAFSPRAETGTGSRAAKAMRATAAISRVRIAAEATRAPRRSQATRTVRSNPHMSHAYVIEGGRPLVGEVTCSGAGKNSALKILAGALLAPGTSVISRVPDIADLRWFADVLRHLACDVNYENGTVTLGVPEHLGTEAPYELVSRMRASTAVLGPLLARA